jgi:hypothetical protein
MQIKYEPVDLDKPLEELLAEYHALKDILKSKLQKLMEDL